MVGVWLVKISDLVPCNCDYIMQTVILPMLKLEAFRFKLHYQQRKAVLE